MKRWKGTQQEQRVLLKNVENQAMFSLQVIAKYYIYLFCNLAYFRDRFSQT